MTEPFAPHDVRVERARRATLNAQGALVVLCGLLMVVVLIALGLLIYQGQKTKELAARVEVVLEAQKEDDAQREADIAALLVKIDEQQRVALEKHDKAAQVYLRRSIELITEELRSPVNQERPR